MDFAGGDEIRFERAGRAGLVTLTRPAALNALSHRMVRALSAALAEWARDDRVEIVVVRAEGRAFCAGGDLMVVYENRGNTGPAVGFFADEYRLNAQVAAFPKPYVSLIDGVVMGGGVGISFHGSHRVLTEKALFAMPEVGIGFFPDVGASHLLPRLPGYYGMYLGLTGNRIRCGDALACGLATHLVQSERLADLLDRLVERAEPDDALGAHAIRIAPESEQAHFAAVARHFSAPSLCALIEGLSAAAAAGDPFAAGTLARMEACSPTSLCIAFRTITQGARLEMPDCMRMEFRVVSRVLDQHDFYEGIRAAIIDKGDTPRWQPATLAEVDEAMIEGCFAPLGDRELAL